jgi:hypothetical protein
MSKFKSNAIVEDEQSSSEETEKSTRHSQTKAILNKFIEEETKVVKGKFRNFETPGAGTRIMVRKYPGIPMFDKVMMDGASYEIPLYVARHLNGTDVTATKANRKLNTCAFPTHGFMYDNSGKMPGSADGDNGIPVPIIAPAKWTRRYAFESLEFDSAE